MRSNAECRFPRFCCAGFVLVALMVACGCSEQKPPATRWIVVADSGAGEFVSVAVPQHGTPSAERFVVNNHGQLRTHGMAFGRDGLLCSLGGATAFTKMTGDVHLLLDGRFVSMPVPGSAEMVQRLSELRYASWLASAGAGTVFLSPEGVVLFAGGQSRVYPIEDIDPESRVAAAGNLVAVRTRSRELLVLDTLSGSVTLVSDECDGRVVGMSCESVFIGVPGSKAVDEVSILTGQLGRVVGQLKPRFYGSIIHVFSAFDSAIIVEVPDMGNQTVIYDRDDAFQPLRIAETSAYAAALAPIGWQPREVEE